VSLRVGETFWLAIASYFTLRSAYLVWKEYMGALKYIPSHKLKLASLSPPGFTKASVGKNQENAHISAV